MKSFDQKGCYVPIGQTNGHTEEWNKIIGSKNEGFYWCWAVPPDYWRDD